MASKRELNSNVKSAVARYEAMNLEQVQKAFLSDFDSWEQKHFECADKPAVKDLRNTLASKDKDVQSAPLLRISESLVNYGQMLRECTEASLGENTNTLRNHEATLHSSDQSVAQASYSQQARTTANSSQSTERMGHSRLSMKPGDVGKLMTKDVYYEGKPNENIWRRFELFLSACRLNGISVENKDVMWDTMYVCWLKGAARTYFGEHLRSVSSPKVAVARLEQHFLNIRVRRVNEDKWSSLTFSLIRRKQISSGTSDRSNTFESALNMLFNEIDELVDLRIEERRYENTILSKIIAAIRDEPMFQPLCYQPPECIEDMKALLRGVAVEHDYKQLLSMDLSGRSVSNFVDRRYESRRVPGYGARYQGNRSRSRSPGRRTFSRSPSPFRGSRGVKLTLRDGTVIQPNQCAVCKQFGCHSSKHKKASNALFAALADVNDDHQGEDSEKEVHASESLVSFVSNARLSSRLGVSPTDHLGFTGMVIDTGTSLLSTIGFKWLPTLSVITGKSLLIRKLPEDLVSIGGVGATTIRTSGSVSCPFLFGYQLYHVRVYLVPGFSPFLLSHRDMDRFGISYHSLEKTMNRPDDGFSEKVVWQNNLPYLPLSAPSLFSEAQLMRIHRSLGHASPDKVLRLLEVADPDQATDTVRETLRKIVKSCNTCSLTQPAPRRFLFSSRYEGKGEFNSAIYVDVMKLIDGYIIHVVCGGTSFQTGKFLESMTAKNAWEALCAC